VVIGRDIDGPGRTFADEKMSRVHFRVAYDGRSQAHRFGDPGSRNGTHLNGVRTTARQLELGDVLRAGDTVLVYCDPSRMEEVEARVARIAPTELTALILGETGTGKERIAKALHQGSGRSGAFVAINCAALPKELLLAELFGHTKGAFSGATQVRARLFQAANRGTLLLDEIGDLPLDLQPVLLRALQESKVRPVGADQEVPVDVRLVSATHAPLDEKVADGAFRADLYARLCQVVIRAPPLRERRHEVLALAKTFAGDVGQNAFEVSADAAEALVRWNWPLNVRELESLVKAFCSMRPGEPLTLEHLTVERPEITAGFRQDAPPAQSARRAAIAAATGGRTGKAEDGLEPSRPELESLLRQHDGNVSAVADQMGKTRAQVYRWLRRVGLRAQRFR
jgi:transcriptional regulator with GAF, ATPase, and Fis domain